MKRLLALCLITPLLAQAAQWSKVGKDGVSEHYIDKSSIIKSDKGQKAWSLVSFASEQTTPEGKPFRSMKALHAYSCEERTATVLSQVYYAEPMGKGATVQSIKYEKFNAEDIVPDTPTESALKVVCKAPKK